MERGFYRFAYQKKDESGLSPVSVAHLDKVTGNVLPFIPCCSDYKVKTQASLSLSVSHLVEMCTRLGALLKMLCLHKTRGTMPRS